MLVWEMYGVFVFLICMLSDIEFNGMGVCLVCNFGIDLCNEFNDNYVVLVIVKGLFKYCFLLLVDVIKVLEGDLKMLQCNIDFNVMIEVMKFGQLDEVDCFVEGMFDGVDIEICGILFGVCLVIVECKKVWMWKFIGWGVFVVIIFVIIVVNDNLNFGLSYDILVSMFYDYLSDLIEVMVLVNVMGNIVDVVVVVVVVVFDVVVVVFEVVVVVFYVDDVGSFQIEILFVFYQIYWMVLVFELCYCKW